VTTPSFSPGDDEESPMTKKLRLGAIGAGSWAVASHLPNFARRRDEVEFVAVSRKGPELLEKIKHDWGFEVASEDYHDVIDAGIDICLVSSPTALHHEHAKAALEAGVHVLVEKPVTIDPADAWDLVETADRKGLYLVCSFGWNFMPMLRGAKQLIDEKGIGEVEHLVVHMSSVTRELLSNTGSYPAAAPESVPAALLRLCGAETPPSSRSRGTSARCPHCRGLASRPAFTRGAAVPKIRRWRGLPLSGAMASVRRSSSSGHLSGGRRSSGTRSAPTPAARARTRRSEPRDSAPT
jgi:hypothetical protein